MQVNNLTEEQQQIVDHVPDDGGQRIVINAYAGSGKTTTCCEVIKRHSGKRWLYLVFNKAMQMSAQSRMKKLGADCKTTHSLAWTYCKENAPFPFRGVSMDKKDRPSAYRVNHFMQIFFQTKATESFFTTPHEKDKPGDMEYKREALEWWREMKQGYKPFFTHDAYLKYMVVDDNSVAWIKDRYDCIIVDEAQDTGDVLVDWIVHKLNMPVYLVGDQHQSIYAFRRATNAMRVAEALTDEAMLFRFSLTKSFRFGGELAATATAFLRGVKGEYSVRDGPVRGLESGCTWVTTVGNAHSILTASKKAKDSSPFSFGMDTNDDNEDEDGDEGGEEMWARNLILKYRGAKPCAVIGRTNAGVFLTAFLCAKDRNEKVYFVGKEGVKDVLKSIEDVCKKYGKMDRERLTQHHRNASEIDKDFQLATALKLLIDFGEEKLKSMMRYIVEHKAKRIESAEWIMGTCHAHKGLEYDNVIMLNDFKGIDEIKKGIAETKIKWIQEANLIYVAMTRAKNVVIIPNELNPFVVTSEKSLQLSKRFFRNVSPTLLTKKKKRKTTTTTIGSSGKVKELDDQENPNNKKTKILCAKCHEHSPSVNRCQKCKLCDNAIATNGIMNYFSQIPSSSSSETIK